jgi:hypothetical protein
LLVKGHAAAATTQTRAVIDSLHAHGAFPVFCDIFDHGAFRTVQPIGRE